MRAFVAVEISDSCRAAVGRFLEKLRPAAGGLRFVPAENLHVTVKFLGDVAAERLPEIVEALRGAAAGRGPIRFGVRGVGGFPNLRAPRVLWIGGMDPEGRLADLAAAVERATEPLGFPPEGRGFTLHVTIARPRDGRIPGGLRQALEGPEPDFGETLAHRMVLMESLLDPSGAKYRPSAEIALG
ncbi:MAG: RNA 2',3'-cyclic phosphodiesterase [Planctomycetales bacterium]|nr:RNA 2',3'-cyclic phosphodiesterase [Planctomycetales bacterium]